MDMVRLMKLPKAMILFFGLVSLLLIAGACGDDDEDTPQVDVEPIERGADVPIVISAGEPIVIGVSTALTGGPTGERGAEYRDAAIVAVERWKQQNGEKSHQQNQEAKEGGGSLEFHTSVSSQSGKG